MSDITISKPTTERFTIGNLFRSYKNTTRLKQLVILLILGIGAVIMIMPFEWMIATSFSRSANIAMPRIIRLFPADPSFFNYQVAMTNLRWCACISIPLLSPRSPRSAISC